MTDREGLPVVPQSDQGPSPERLSDILPSILPLAQQYLENQRHELALKERALERDAELQEKAVERDAAVEEKEIAFEHQQWRWQVIFLAGMSLAFLGIASGLIFYLRELNAGLLVLSHLAALAAGVVGGLGWARRKGEEAGLDEADPR